MPDNKWDDDKLEKLLHSMPKMSDERSAAEILERLKKDERLSATRRPKRHRWMPAIVAVAALLVLSLIVPSILKGNIGQYENSSQSDQMVSDDAAKSKADVTEEFESGEIEESEVQNYLNSADTTAFSSKSMIASHVILEEEVRDVELFPLGLIHEANVVPVTFLIPNSKIENDFPKGELDSVALYNKYAKLINEEELGFDDYHPYKGEISESGNTVIHQVPEDHKYDLSPATLGAYTFSAKATFGDHNDWKVIDTNGKPKSFDYIGKDMSFPLTSQSAYYKYVMTTGETYLIPYENKGSESVDVALLSMKDAENGIVQELIPSSINFKVEDSKGLVVLTFDESLDFSTLPENEALEMIEGIMLTVGSFNMQVQLKNIEQDHLGKYDLTKPLPKPIGANPILWN